MHPPGLLAAVQGHRRPRDGRLLAGRLLLRLPRLWKYDFAGRVYKGVPAPINLQVPPYTYLTDNTILIGEDKKEA